MLLKYKTRKHDFYFDYFIFLFEYYNCDDIGEENEIAFITEGTKKNKNLTLIK